MTEIKPRIFIGSSREGLPIAQCIEKDLADVADCKIWPLTFEFGNSTYEDLVNRLSLYDYGILVATADDITISRKTKTKSIRDNIVFEFGLFAGRLGRDKAFLMVEQGAKIPSDLNGITLPFIPTGRALWEQKLGLGKGKDEAQLKKVIDNCAKIKAHIKSHERMYNFGFLPSTALAYGYYNNFVLKAVSQLLDMKKLKVGHTCPFPRQCQKSEHESGNIITNLLNDTPFTDVKFTILIPENLSADMFDTAKDSRVRNNWEQIKIDAGDVRPFDFYVHGNVAASGILELSDIPITLNSLREAIKAYVKKSYVGITDAEQLLETREIRQFQQVLDFLIQANPITKDRVITQLVNR